MGANIKNDHLAIIRRKSLFKPQQKKTVVLNFRAFIIFFRARCLTCILIVVFCCLAIYIRKLSHCYFYASFTVILRFLLLSNKPTLTTLAMNPTVASIRKFSRIQKIYGEMLEALLRNYVFFYSQIKR